MTEWFEFYEKNGGDLTKLTVSSDSSITSPQNLFEQIRSCIVEHGHPPDKILPLVTSNTANALKLPHKGKIQAGKAADILVLKKETLELRDAVSAGKILFRNGKADFKEEFLKESNRYIELAGEKEIKKAAPRFRPS